MAQRYSMTSRGGNGKRDMMMTSGMALLGGAGLALWGLTRESLTGKLLGIVPGAYAVAQGVNMATAMREGTPKSIAKEQGVEIEQKVRVQRSPDDVYSFVRDLKNLPRAMSRVHEVHEEEDGRIHWVWQTPMGLKVEQDMRIIDEEPGRVLTWVSTAEEPWAETGSFVLEAADGGTDVTMRLAWEFPGGMAGTLMSKSMEGYTDRMMRDELNSLKRYLEREHVATGVQRTSMGSPGAMSGAGPGETGSKEMP